ncbi:hypothetical protein ACAG25_14665 [Mycobacterium sp. pV006]|uniref:hypothetical protein n=1 Tax=Mycobacterium sp. pV006 TaxID=3238983 RepID=UPI00351B8EA9
MTEPVQSRPEQATVTGERRAVESPPYEGGRNRASSILIWVGIVAGVVFIVAVVFFSGFFMGRYSSGDFRDGHHQPGMMGPGMMRPGMMGPNQWPGHQPTTTAPTTPRP